MVSLMDWLSVNKDETHTKVTTLTNHNILNVNNAMDWSELKANSPE